MSPLKRSNNIAARMGRWSASHWKTAVFGWLVFVVAALFVGNLVGTKNIDTADANVGQAHKADQILKHAFPQVDPQTELVLVQSSSKTVTRLRPSARRSRTSRARSPAIPRSRTSARRSIRHMPTRSRRTAARPWSSGT